MIMVYINNERIDQIKQGLTVIERLDEELDSALMIQVASKRKEQYPMFSKVEINRDNEILEFLVSSDDSELISKDPLLYQHTIMLIEPTKALERQTGASLTFTQPLGGTRYTMEDVLNRTKNVIPFETVANLESTRKFNLDPNLASYLRGFKAPQFFINRSTLLGAVNQEIKYVNATGRIKGFNTLKADFHNELKEQIELNDLVGFKQSQNIEYYATKLESYVDNQIAEKNLSQSALIYPSANSWGSVRSDDVRLTSNNMVFKLPFPIYKINKVEIHCKIRYKQPLNSNLIDITINNDITDHVFESSAWKVLDPIAYADTINKSNTLKYDYQGDRIYGFSDIYGGVTKYSAIEFLLMYVINPKAPVPT